jgi:hypothetical protein
LLDEIVHVNVNEGKATTQIMDLNDMNSILSRSLTIRILDL